VFELANPSFRPIKLIHLQEKQEWPFAEVSESVLYLDLSQDADVEPRPARGSGDVEMQRDGCKTAASSTPNSIDCEHGSSPRAWLAHAGSARVMDSMAERALIVLCFRVLKVEGRV